MQKEILDAVYEDAKRLDEINYGVGDALDVKASILLLVITFLGTLSGQILGLTILPRAMKVVQLIAVLGICTSGVLTLLALWPRRFSIAPAPEEMLNYAEELAVYFEGEPNQEELLLERFRRDRRELTSERISKNNQIAATKTRFNELGFYAITVSAAAELITLLWLAFWHLF